MNNPAMIVGVIVFVVLTILMFEVLLLPEVKKRQKKSKKQHHHVPGESKIPPRQTKLRSGGPRRTA